MTAEPIVSLEELMKIKMMAAAGFEMKQTRAAPARHFRRILDILEAAGVPDFEQEDTEDG